MNPARLSLWNRWFAPATLAFLLLVPLPESRAATITFVSTDLTNTTLGEDLWLFEYRVSDFTFASGEGFTITFDRVLFTKLQTPPPLVNANWDVLTLQPDLALSSNGLYDALALRAAPSLANGFRVTTVWLGVGTPGPQPFAIHDASFGTIATGQTTPVPEPTTTALLLFSVSLLAQRRPRSGSRRLRQGREALPKVPTTGAGGSGGAAAFRTSGFAPRALAPHHPPPFPTA